MKKKINIIGAGIAGLSAGCYLQMNGYETEIFEMHTIPGGLCTSWDKKGYTIDTCIHWLVGSSPSDNFYPLWNELLDLTKLKFIEPDLYSRVVNEDDEYIDIFTDVNKMEKEFLAKAPEDRNLIIEFTNAIRKFSKLNLPNEKAQDIFNIFDTIKFIVNILPYLGDFNKWIKIPAKDYAAQCKNKLLKLALDSIFVPEMSHLFLIFTMAWFNKKSAGYPIGGSLNFAKLIEKRYVNLGGKIHYGSKVKKIICDESNPSIAKGILLEKGTTHPADITISAADGHYTIFEMLDGKFTDEKIRGYYSDYLTFSSYFQISVGINRLIEDKNHTCIYKLKNKIELEPGNFIDGIQFRIFNFDPTMAPAGKTIITSMIDAENYEYWTKLRKDDYHKYQAEKDRIARQVIDVLEEKLGNIRDNVEMIDVSTPATVIRYTNNWKGSFEGWLMTPRTGFKQMKKELPGLSNFYMIGQWVEPGGGLPSALLSGRNVTQIICKKDKKKFETQSFLQNKQ